MLGRSSLSIDLKKYDQQLKRTLREIRAKKRPITEDVTGEKPGQLKEYFTPSTYNSPMDTHLLDVTTPFDIDLAMVQMLPSLY